MSGTRRVPLVRRPAVQITPRAIGLYEAMRGLRCTCPSPKPPTQGPCPGCARWFDLHAELHTELRCKPWEWPCVARRSPKAAGSIGPDAAIRATMALLDEAVRQRADSVGAGGAAREPPARKDGEDTNADPLAGESTPT